MTEYPCPFCGAAANLASGCTGCGRGPDEEAAEVVRLNSEIGELTLRVAQVRREYDAAVALLTGAQQRRSTLVTRVRARRSPPPPPATAPAPAAVAGMPAAGAEKKVSAFTVQSVLFILGGLLLGTGAIVFTLVAWATFGVTGRAAILAGATLLALGVPVVAARRGLTGTAETFAAVGLLMVLLDGYAAWSVDLAGVASLPQTTYGAGVCAVTAAIAAGYGGVTRLVGPRFAAVVAAQPALPLAAVELHPSAAGWALILSAVAAGNLAAVRVPRMGAAGWPAFGLALSASAASALVAESSAADSAGAALAGGALLGAALVLAGGAVVARHAVLREVAGGVLVAAVMLAAGRLLVVTWPDWSLVLTATVVAAVAAAVAGSTRAGLTRVGPWASAMICLGAVGGPVAAVTGVAAVLPDHYDWQLPVAVASLAAGLVALLTGWEPARLTRPYAVAAGAALVVLAVPSGVDLHWWSTALLDLVAAAAFAALAVLKALAGVHSDKLHGLGRSPGLAGVRVGAAVVLSAHAVGVSSASAAVLGAVALIGCGVAALAHQRSTMEVLGGAGLAVGVAVWPAAAGTALQAADVVPWWVGRGTLAAVAVLPPVVAAVRRWWPEYTMFAASAAVGVTGVASLWSYGGEESGPVYASAGALLVAATAVVGRDAKAGGGVVASRWLAAVAVVLGLRVAVGAGPALWELLGAPYRQLGAVWSGDTDVSIVDAGTVAAALAVLAVATILLARAWGLLVAPFALLVGLVAVDARWPAVPVTSLVLGLAGALAVALHRVRAPALLVAVPLAGAGLSGTLAAEATTLAGLGLVVVTGAVAGCCGRTPGSRIWGWLVAVAAAASLAAAAAFTAGVDRRGAAFWTLAAAAAALALGGVLHGRRRGESRAVDVAAHAAAVVAFLLTVGSISHAAAVCTLWGVATGMRAFWPAANRARAAGSAYATATAGAAAGCELLAWWLLLASREVAVIEAYTIPAAAVALLAGVLVRKAGGGSARRAGGREVNSWAAYGPALAAAFLPSLASILVDPQAPLRRLALGLGALAVLVVGAQWRNQAGVVAGGVVVALVAVHELTLVWQLLPTWIPLTVAGLLLVWLAVTYERRRRDLARLRTAVNRMS